MYKHGGVLKKLNINYYERRKNQSTFDSFHTGKLLHNITLFQRKDINVNASNSINPMMSVVCSRDPSLHSLRKVIKIY